MYNELRNAEKSKKVWETRITAITLALCLIGLIGASIVSFFQTMRAFVPLNDPTTFLGTGIAFLFALIFQYGQNAALYVKVHYTSGKEIFWGITDSALCLIIFGVCAVIDAGTNCYWLYLQPDIIAQPIYFRVIEYSAMILVVFVEEVIGKVLQAFSHSLTMLKKINLVENTKHIDYPKSRIPDISSFRRKPVAHTPVATKWQRPEPTYTKPGVPSGTSSIPDFLKGEQDE